MHIWYALFLTIEDLKPMTKLKQKFIHCKNILFFNKSSWQAFTYNPCDHLEACLSLLQQSIRGSIFSIAML